MGWFWADPTPSAAASSSSPSACPVKHSVVAPPAGTPPRGCPMHTATVDALSGSAIKAPTTATSAAAPSSPQPSGCPVPHDQRARAVAAASASASASASTSTDTSSTLSKLNPLNYMFHNISQAPAPNQTVVLPTSREESTIPRGDGEGTWEYPSPQQMYNALLRKGYTDTDATAVESMVAVHNFLNEGAWAEIVDWERRFGRGLSRGWEISRRGEANAEMATRILEHKEGLPVGEGAEPRLIRFQGRPGEMTPKAAFVQLLGRLYPAKFATEPPFDRHDWYVARNVNGQEKQVRYVIDYYAGEPEPTGEPVFYLDVRPAMSVTGAAERLVRWGGDVWWRASGGAARE